MGLANIWEQIPCDRSCKCLGCQFISSISDSTLAMLSEVLGTFDSNFVDNIAEFCFDPLHGLAVSIAKPFYQSECLSLPVKRTFIIRTQFLR